MTDMRVSVVIPCYYSEATIAKVVTMTKAEFDARSMEYEFILVNDGSTDGTFQEIEKLCLADDRIVGINLAKNAGQHSAVMAGLRQVSGDVVMVMDDDMQTHPSQCMALLDSLDQSTDVVFATYPKQKTAAWRRLGSSFTVWSMRVLTKRPKGIVSSSFFVMKRFVSDELIKYNGPYTYIQGLIFRTTWNIKNVEVKHFDREVGRSGYTLKTLFKLWSTVLGFSLLPLRFVFFSGVAVGCIGFIAGIVLIIQRLLDSTMQMGWSSLMVAILICSGFIMVSIGLVGEYLGRLFMTVNNTPQYVEKRLIDNRVSRRMCDAGVR